MAFRVAVAVLLLSSNFWETHSKIYDRCELARELRDVHEIPEKHLATWLCIANYESNFNTSAHNPGSGDHGLFQISELYWCSPPGDGFACGLPCSALKDEDIEDDVICAKRIYRQHQRISGDGFTAWVVYNLYCKNPSHVASFIQGCFEEENLVKYGYQPIYAAMNLPTMRVPMPTTPPPPLTTLPPIPSTFASPFFLSTSSPPPPYTSTTQRVPPSTTTFFKPSTAAIKFQEKTTMKSSFKAVTTFAGVKATSAKPRITVSTYKPLLNLSSSRSTYVPMLPQVSSKVSVFTPTVAKPRTTFITRSTYKPLPSLFSTTPTSFKFTTVKPPISTYKPFLNKFSPVFRTSPKPPQQPIRISSTTFGSLVTGNVESTTPKLANTISTYKPFLNRFSKTSKSQLFTTAKPPLVAYDDRFTKSVAIKPREAETPLPFTLKSGVKPFQFKRDEKVYAFVNKSGYAFAISSHGFKLYRVGE